MKNTIRILVLIWLATFSTPVNAGDMFTSKENVEKMYLARKEEQGTVGTYSNYQKSPKKESNDYFIIIDSETVISGDLDDDEVAEKEVETPKKSETIKEEKEEELPRLKRVYLGVYGGYFYTKKDMVFEDVRKCGGNYQSPFFCSDENALNPMNIEYKDDYFLSAVFGINSANILRLELSYFRLGKEIEMEGLNIVEGVSQKYAGSLDLKGGSINLYLDLVGKRQKPYLMFVPYVMAGIGASEINLGDIEFTDRLGTSYSLAGKDQRNKTVVYGAGFTAGLNNYISLDIGYRYYDFGDVKTDVGLDNGTTVYDVQLESELKAHIATVGLKFQI